MRKYVKSFAKTCESINVNQKNRFLICQNMQVIWENMQIYAIDLHISRKFDSNQLFACWVFIMGLLELNMKVRQDTPEHTYFRIGHRLELKYVLLSANMQCTTFTLPPL